jgi:hypothetical protein
VKLTHDFLTFRLFQNLNFGLGRGRLGRGHFYIHARACMRL